MSIAGVTARAMQTPADRVELVAMVQSLAAAGKTFAFAGGGTELELGNPPRELDTVIRTTALARVIDYSPEDQTITVEAGMRIAAIDAILAKHDQVLPIDVGDRKNATIGGAIATNAFGAQRHRYGSIKDLIVGIEIVRPDGVTARGGGKVVKNVAGFDMPKLMVGSLGTLGAITSATFRVFPKPALTQAVLVRAGCESAFFAACMDDRSLEPVAVVHYSTLDGIVLTFAGLPAAVEQQLLCAADLAAAHGAAIEALDRAALERCAAAESAVRTSGQWRWTRHTSATRSRASSASRVPAAREVVYPTFGVSRTSVDEDASIDEVVRSRGTSVVFHAMPQRARGHIDAWGEPPPSFPLMRALKNNFDPKGLCNPGRYVGGL